MPSSRRRWPLSRLSSSLRPATASRRADTQQPAGAVEAAAARARSSLSQGTSCSSVGGRARRPTRDFSSSSIREATRSPVLTPARSEERQRGGLPERGRIERPIPLAPAGAAGRRQALAWDSAPLAATPTPTAPAQRRVAARQLAHSRGGASACDLPAVRDSVSPVLRRDAGAAVRSRITHLSVNARDSKPRAAPWTRVREFRSRGRDRFLACGRSGSQDGRDRHLTRLEEHLVGQLGGTTVDYPSGPECRL